MQTKWNISPTLNKVYQGTHIFSMIWITENKDSRILGCSLLFSEYLVRTIFIGVCTLDVSVSAFSPERKTRAKYKIHCNNKRSTIYFLLFFDLNKFTRGIQDPVQGESKTPWATCDGSRPGGVKDSMGHLWCIPSRASQRHNGSLGIKLPLAT